MMQSTRIWTPLAVAALAALATATPGRSEPLAPEACAAVEAEHATLVSAGIPEVVKKGPAAAGTGKAKEVARYIQLQEQLLFRCGHDKKRVAPLVGDGEEATDSTAVAKEATPVPPLPKRKPVAAKPTPAQARATAPAASKPAAKTPVKAKAKVDDAYRPPAKEPAKSP